METMMINYLKPALTAVALALALTACDSKQENQREKALENKADALEDRADTVRKQGEAAADRVEKQDPGIDSRTTDRSADANREVAEKRADQLEDQADRVREKK
jgi:hypothetical protein